MKTLLIAFITSIALVSSYGALANAEAAQNAQMQECFRAHGNLMDKPSVKNLIACWRAHGNLMTMASSVKDVASVGKLASKQTVDRDYILMPEGQY